MGKNISPPAAVPFRTQSVAFAVEVSSITVSLIFLLNLQSNIISLQWYLVAVMAFFLTLMIDEDAHEQTVDIALLSIIGVIMLFVSTLYGQSWAFLKDAVIGVCFFRFLLALTTFWLTFRTKSISPLYHKDLKDDLSSLQSGGQATGYLPIFMVVFVLRLGLGESFAPFVFLHTAITLDIIEDLVGYYPLLPYFGITVWLMIEGILWWLEHMRTRQIVWAFGGGDVLFLGLFAGYLGLVQLLALYFLSLIARVVFSLLQFFLDSKIASI